MTAAASPLSTDAPLPDRDGDGSDELIVRPLVSFVVLAVDAPAADLERTIASLRQQTWTEWEAIAIRSPGAAPTAVDDHRVGHLTWAGETDERAPVPTVTINRVVASMGGQWIVLLHAGDELYLPSELDICEQCIARTGEVGALLSGWRWHDGTTDLTPWKPRRPCTSDTIVKRPDRPPASIWVRRDWWQRLGGLDETLGVAAPWELLLRLAIADCPMDWLKRVAVWVQRPGILGAIAPLGPDTDDFERAWRRQGAMAAFGLRAFAKACHRIAWWHFQLGRSDAAANALVLSRNGRRPRSRDAAVWIDAFETASQENGVPFDADRVLSNGAWQQAIARETAPIHLRETGLEFVLYRVLGNALPPRHRPEQTLENLRFMLDREPPLAHCEKRWVVNRIVDRDLEAAVIDMLEQAGQPYLRIPFEEADYATMPFELHRFPQANYFHSTRFQRGSDLAQAKAIDAAYARKNRYVMHNNGGRNAALRDGRPRARWILPWDGNCFLTTAAWQSVREAIAAAGDRAKYILVPMVRLLDNDDLFSPTFVPNPVEEPQVAFRYDAIEEFDEERHYGRMPKVELLKRLDVRGPWDAWPWAPWEKPALPRSEEAHCTAIGGWVARLASGNVGAEVDSDRRRDDRFLAVWNFLDALDDRAARQTFRREVPPLLAAVGEQPDALETAICRYIQGAVQGTLDGNASGNPSATLDPSAIAAIAAETLDIVSPEATPIAPKPALATAIALDGMRHGTAIAGAESWARSRLDWLQTSDPGRAAAADLGALGTGWSLEVGAIALYLDDVKTANWILSASLLRPMPVASVTDADPPDAAIDWVGRLAIARLGQAIGLDLWHQPGWQGQTLAAALAHWLQRRADDPWFDGLYGAARAINPEFVVEPIAIEPDGETPEDAPEDAPEDVPAEAPESAIAQ